MSFTEFELYSQGTDRGTRLVNDCVFVLYTVQPNNNKEDKIKTKLKFEIKIKRSLKGLSNLQKYERVKDFLKYIETPFQM